MVQEKDAAKKRHQHRLDFLDAERKRYRDSILKTVWVVVETVPEVPYDGGWDRGTPEVNRVVSPDFDSREEAAEWMDRHEADKGKYLRIGHKDLRQISYNQWTGVFYERVLK